MAKRKGITPSLRWSVFARDGFTCRYCGAQAGQDGVELHADHVLSVIEGGENTFDNLVTACSKCNGGKGARSLKGAPTSTEVIKRINQRTSDLQQQAQAIAVSIEAKKQAEQAAVNLKCSAYEVESTRMEQGECTLITGWCREFGADAVVDWYQTAHRRDVRERNAVKYVCGIVRNIRKEAEGADQG